MNAKCNQTYVIMKFYSVFRTRPISSFRVQSCTYFITEKEIMTYAYFEDQNTSIYTIRLCVLAIEHDFTCLCIYVGVLKEFV